jgi:hypothetical protein
MTTPLEKAERDLNNLEEQREALFHRTKTLSKQREAVAHAALVAGDKASKDRLKEINLETLNISTNIESVEAALTVARSNLANAKAAVAGAADREKAEQIAALNSQFKEQLEDADEAFSDAISSVLSARDLLMKMHTLGVAAPTDQQFRINAVACIKTVIQMLPGPYINDFEFMRLAPSQKKTFRPLAAGWHDQIANQIAARLPKKEEAA